MPNANDVVWGEYVPHDHLSIKNVTNALLTVFVLAPSFAIAAWLYSSCDALKPHGDACVLAIEQPLTFANVLFFVNVTVGFWIIGLLQRSFWLIDPYWTLLPPLLGHLYQAHPRAVSSPTRSVLVLGLLWLWAFRLTHSYFRREDWKFGQREDWRYTKMAKENPKLWPLLSFFAVGLAQQPMLIGISAPAYTVHTTDAPLGLTDLIIVAGCLAGLGIAWHADNELRQYTLSSPRPSPILQSGLWRYSRHPNYFGEQLWWWSFAMFAFSLGQPIMLCGTAFNSIILAVVTVMTEQKMLSNWAPARAELYREYMRTTSPCVPWFNYGSTKAKGL